MNEVLPDLPKDTEEITIEHCKKYGLLSIINCDKPFKGVEEAEKRVKQNVCHIQKKN